MTRPDIFHDGPAIPRELLDYIEGVKLMRSDSFKNIIGVVKSSKNVKYRLLGHFLKPNEYLIIEGVGEFYKNEPAHFA